jgi:DNA-binding NtrC family response regulator
MDQPYRILHLDDDEIVLDAYADALQATGAFAVRSFRDAKAFLKAAAGDFDAALIDLHLTPAAAAEGLVIIETLAQRPSGRGGAPTLFALSDDVGSVRAALQAGADDFVLKQASLAEVALRIQRCLAAARRQASASHAGGYLGRAMQKIAARVPRLVDSAVRAVHVYGETGTGKELVADLFAQAVGRGAPFLRVHCGAISPDVLESELFGHAKGAFTGAAQDRAGFLEAAHRGWLFLDEIHLLAPSAQAALLRALETHEVVRVGEHRPRPADFRLISAANVRLEAGVAAGTFKADLWQRISETRLELAPVRERRDEIAALVGHFCEAERGGPYRLAPGVLEALVAYDWRAGNVREIRSCVRAMTEHQVDGELTPSSVPEWLWTQIAASGSRLALAPAGAGARQVVLPFPSPCSFQEMSDRLLREMIAALRSERPEISLRELGEALGFPKSTLISRMQRLAIPLRDDGKPGDPSGGADDAA